MLSQTLDLVPYSPHFASNMLFLSIPIPTKKIKLYFYIHTMCIDEMKYKREYIEVLILVRVFRKWTHGIDSGQQPSVETNSPRTPPPLHYRRHNSAFDGSHETDPRRQGELCGILFQCVVLSNSKTKINNFEIIKIQAKRKSCMAKVYLLARWRRQPSLRCNRATWLCRWPSADRRRRRRPRGCCRCEGKTICWRRGLCRASSALLRPPLLLFRSLWLYWESFSDSPFPTYGII